MITADNVPPVDDKELLARFIVNKNEFRPSDDTVKPKLFLPFKKVALSVNRHRDSNDEELWEVGNSVAKSRRCCLYGRSDITALACKVETLDVIAKPLDENPNHADIEGFPVKN